MPTPGARLRSAWSSQTLMIPGVFNALTAKMAERLGFPAIYLSGGALSAGWAGVPDIGLLSVTEFAEQAAILARACSLPLLCDADTGFGDVLNVERTVQLYEAAGAAGLHLEDQVMPKRCGHLSGKSLVSIEAMCAKIQAAVASRRDPDFVVIARTDARTVEGFESALARARAYIEAGADVIFPEALETAQEFAGFASECSFPLIANMTEFGRGPLLDFSQLRGYGYHAVLYPLTAFRAASKAAEETLRSLRATGSQRDLLTSMQTRAELYDLIGYTNWEARDRAYFQVNADPEAS